MSDSFEGLLKAFESLNQRKRNNPDCLSASEKARWRVMRCQIEEALFQIPRDPARDTREFLRVPVTIKVRYRVAGRLTKRCLTVLGEGGLFISSRDFLPIGSQLQIEVIPAGESAHFEVRGQIVWTCKMGNPDECGMGIKFVKLTDPIKRHIHALLDATLRKDLIERRKFSRVDAGLGVHVFAPERPVDLRTSDIGIGGMLMSWAYPAPARDRLQFELHLPGNQPPVNGLAEVARLVEKPWGRSSGSLGVRFTDLSRQGHDAIQAYLGRQAAGQLPARGSERRVFARIKRRIKLRFIASNSFGTTDTRDISGSGVFLQTRQPPSWGSLVEIALSQPGSGETLSLPGRVVRVVHTDPQKPDRVPGVGVAFEDMSEMRLSILRAFLRDFVLQLYE
ncbi:MAG: PilZ domain-containing protein [Deltaproteobacteria bacterium]|nr:PilZ domain-containing protein [Deltaproteobacteria bacterium]